MSGKAILFLVMSFSVIFLVMGRNLGDVSTRSVENSVKYYKNTLSHEIAVSGANLAAAKISYNPEWDAGFPETSFDGGSFETTVEEDGEKRIVTTIGRYDTTTSRVQMIIAPSKFSKYAYFCEDEDKNGTIYWMTKDTCWGPFHTQDKLYVSGRPVFYGRVTTKLGVVKKSPSDNPRFLGGYGLGDCPLPSNGVTNLKDDAMNNGGKVFNFTSSSTIHYQNFYLTFKNDSVTYKVEWQKKKTTSPYNWIDQTPITETKLISDISSNGVIFLNGTDGSGNGLDIRLKGKVEGSYSVGTDGDVWIDDDIIYNDKVHDMLGIVAKGDVIVTNSTATKNINIQASIYTEKGFTAEDYGSRTPSSCGTINLYGGLIQRERKAVGTFNSSTQQMISGFSKRYIYDERFMTISPPYFPGTNKFEILSWYE